MLGEKPLTFSEYVMQEPLPLAKIHEAALDFLRDRDDAAVSGAYAVNAYSETPRMTQEVGLLSSDASRLADRLRQHLHQRFNIAVRVRTVGDGRGYRVSQVRSSESRHLVDITQVASIPAVRRVGGIAVVAPAELIARKVLSYHRRRGQPKSGTDWRDIAELLLVFPELKAESGQVQDALVELGAEQDLLDLWLALVRQPIIASDEDSEFDGR